MKSFVSRRVVLQGLAVAVGYGATWSTQTALGSGTSPPESVPAPLTATDPAMHVGEAVTASPFDLEWTAVRAVQFPRVINVESVSESFDCVVSWDERLFDVAELVLAEADQVTEISTSKLAPGQLQLSVPAATTRLYFDVAPRPLYPNDNLVDVVPTSIRYSGVEGGSSPLLFLDVDELPVTPWGVELSGEWTTTQGLMTPASLMIRSVGPNPVPAGLRLEIACPAVFDLANLAAPEGVNWVPDNRDDQIIIHAQLTSPMPSGMSITLGFDQGIATTEPKKNLPFVSGARVIAPERDEQSVRDTGKMTAFPLTESGIPVSTFKPRNDLA